MASAQQQRRRGKTQSSSSAGTNNKSENEKLSVQEQLDHAEATVRTNEHRMVQLHKQWKSYLTRLSYMVLFIALHQLQDPLSTCFQDIRTYNEAVQGGEGTATTDESSNTDALVGFQAKISVLMRDNATVVHVLALLMAVLLSVFLQSQPAPEMAKPGRRQKKTFLFSDARYVLCNLCVPPMLTLYFLTARQPVTPCVDEHLWERVAIMEEETPRSQISLPVVLVYHVIVTSCLWFMDLQQSQVETNLQRIAELQIELQRAQQENQSLQQQQQQKKKKTQGQTTQSATSTSANAPSTGNKKEQ